MKYRRAYNYSRPICNFSINIFWWQGLAGKKFWEEVKYCQKFRPKFRKNIYPTQAGLDFGGPGALSTGGTPNFFKNCSTLDFSKTTPPTTTTVVGGVEYIKLAIVYYRLLHLAYVPPCLLNLNNSSLPFVCTEHSTWILPFG